MGDAPRPRWFTARGCLPIVVAMLLAAGILTVMEGDPTAAAARTCNPADVMNHRLAELGRGDYTWTFVPRADAGGGTAETLFAEHQVRIAADAPCGLILSVTNHEWMHVQQARKFGTNVAVFDAYGADGVEMVADCGSQLLGSTDTPYIGQRLKAAGHGCTPRELADAHDLIDAAH
jgi:hypothetical protein